MANRRFAFLFCLLVLSDCKEIAAANSYKILTSAPIPSNIFTQGLAVHNSRLYYSSGLYNQSFIGYIDGTSNNAIRVSRKYFLEGLTYYDGELYALTWNEGALLVFEPNTLRLKGIAKYPGQGWGLTHDGKNFVMSDGSNSLQFRDSQQFKLIKTIQVSYHGTPCYRLNDLTFAKGYIWANVWQSDFILKISPRTGRVIKRWDLSKLTKQQPIKNPEAVLNGLAFDEQKNAFWVTGKLWSNRYLIKFL